LALIQLLLPVQILNRRPNLRISRVLAKKGFQLPAGIGKQRLIDEIDGRRRAFDIEKNNADWRFVGDQHWSYFAAADGGRYLGPQHTGS
jgi:hypothetical protein